MRKRIIMVLLALCLLTGLGASGNKACFDLGFSLGTRSHFFEPEDTAKLNLQWGLAIGLSNLHELDVSVISQLVPGFFADNGLEVLLQRSLLGDRNTGSNIAGMGYNMLLGFGVGFTTFSGDGRFRPTHLLLSVTPIAVGSPALGKRERALALALAFNMYTRQVSLHLDIFLDDFYVVGTYRDHPIPIPASPEP